MGLRQVDAGNIVHASDATGLLLVTQLQPIAVIFTLPEDQLPAVMKRTRGGQKLVVEAYDRSQATRLATGTLLTVDNQIDTTTGTVKAKAVFDNRDGALFPNQFVNVRLLLEQRENALVIPASGLQSGSTGNFVYVVRPGAPPKNASDEDVTNNEDVSGARGGREKGAEPKGSGGQGTEGEPAGPPRKPFYVEIVPVTVDLTEGSQVILKSGVNAGDQIVVDGQEKLKPYSKVDPKKPGTAAALATNGANGGPTDGAGQGNTGKGGAGQRGAGKTQGSQQGGRGGNKGSGGGSGSRP